jgi:hypothetical protein
MMQAKDAVRRSTRHPCMHPWIREPSAKKHCAHRDWYRGRRAIHPNQIVLADLHMPYHRLQMIEAATQFHKFLADSMPALDLMFAVLREIANDRNSHLSHVSSLHCLLPRLDEPWSRRLSVQVIFGVLTRYRACFDVQVEACTLLSALIKTSEDIASPKACVDALVASLETYSSASEAFTLIVLDLLQKVKDCCPDQSDWTEASSVLLLAVAYHPKTSLIQRAGLSLVAWLSENEDCRKRITQNQGLEMIPMLMQLHPLDALICVNAAAALCWIIHAGESTTSRPEFPRYHLPVILSTMSNHINNAAVFGNCVCVLCGLGEMPNEADLLRRIRHGMETHVRSEKVVESCLRFIRFRNVNECADELMLTIDACLDGMRHHKEETHLQAQGCEVLAFMAGFPDLQKELIRKGAVDVVLDVMKRHSKQTRVQRATLLFLALLLPIQGDTTAFGGNVTTLQIICCSVWQP